MYEHRTMSTTLVMFLLNVLLSGTLGNPDLTPSVPDGSAVYINQLVTIQCITRESQAMAWRSDEYIGRGQQLTFNSRSMPGATDTSQIGAEATFVRMDNNNGELTLQSILRISVVPTFSSFTVTCRNIDTGASESVTFQTMSENITEATLLPFEAGRSCPNNNVTIECTARNSQNIQWGSSANIGLSSIMPRCSSGDETQRYDINGIEVTSIAQTSIDNGLVCRLTLSAHGLPVETPLSVTCINLDFQIGVNVSFVISGDCVPTTSMSTSVTSVVVSTTDSDSGSMATEVVAPNLEQSMMSMYVIIGGGVGAGGVILLVLIVIIAVIVATCYKAQKRNSVTADKVQNTNNVYIEDDELKEIP